MTTAYVIVGDSRKVKVLNSYSRQWEGDQKQKQREDIRDKKSRRRRRHKRGKDYGCLSMTAGVEMEMAESQVIQLERVTVSRKKK